MLDSTVVGGIALKKRLTPMCWSLLFWWISSLGIRNQVYMVPRI